MNEYFIKLCMEGDLKNIEKLLENNTTKIIYNILFGFETACWKGHLHIIKYLTKYDIDIYYDNGKIIRIVCTKGHTHILKYLLETYLYLDTFDTLQIKILIHNMILTGCIKGHIDILKYIIEHNNITSKYIDLHDEKDYMFRKTCEFGNIDTMKYLITYSEKQNNKIDIHAESDEALTYTNYFKYSSIVNYLIYLSKHNYIKYTNYKDILYNRCLDESCMYTTILLTKINSKYKQKYILNNNMYSETTNILKNIDYMILII